MQSVTVSARMPLDVVVWLNEQAERDEKLTFSSVVARICQDAMQADKQKAKRK